MPGRQDDGVVGLTRRRWNTGKRRRGKAGGQPGNDPKRDTGTSERKGFLAAPAEDERVTALETHDLLSIFSELADQIVNVPLMRRGLAAAFPGGMELGAIGGKLEDASVDKFIVDDDVGSAQGMDRHEGQEARIARTGTDQPHFSRRELGKRWERRRQTIHTPKPTILVACKAEPQC